MADIDWWARGVGAIGAGLGVWNLLTRRKQVRDSEKEKDLYHRRFAAMRQLAELTEGVIGMCDRYPPDAPEPDSVANRRNLSGRMASRLTSLEHGWSSLWRDTPDEVRKAYATLRLDQHSEWFRLGEQNSLDIYELTERVQWVRRDAIRLLDVIERALA